MTRPWKKDRIEENRKRPGPIAVSRKTQRFLNLQVAAELLSFEGVARCQREIVPIYRKHPVTGKLSIDARNTVKVAYHDELSYASYRNLHCCNSPQCPWCGPSISERRADWLKKFIAGSPDLLPVLATFTMRHSQADTLVENLTKLVGYTADPSVGRRKREKPIFGKTKAKKTLSKRRWIAGAFVRFVGGRAWKDIQKRYGIVGWVKALEVTDNYFAENARDRNGWHAHLHILFFLDKGVVGEDFNPFDLQEEFRDRWVHCLDQVGASAHREIGCKVDTTYDRIQEYITKYGREPNMKFFWTVEREIAKSSTKTRSRRGQGDTPTDLLKRYAAGGPDAPMAGRRYQEYWYAMKGKHPLEPSEGLRALMGEQPPDDLEDVIAAARDVLEMDRIVWNVILKLDLRGALLEQVELHRGDGPKVYAWLVDQLKSHTFKRVDLDKVGAGAQVYRVIDLADLINIYPNAPPGNVTQPVTEESDDYEMYPAMFAAPTARPGRSGNW